MGIIFNLIQIGWINKKSYWCYNSTQKENLYMVKMAL